MKDRVWRRYGRAGVALGLLSALALNVQPMAQARTMHADSSVAPDGPGLTSHFDISRKDCLGTARNTTSKVWYTVANGVLSDVYYPTNDNTNNKTLQYVVTDGSSFADLQQRDTTYTVAQRGPLDCVVTSTAKNGKYRIVSEYITDPNRNTVLIRSSIMALQRHLPLQVYALYNPLLNGNGGGGTTNVGGDTGTVDTSSGHNVLVAYDTNTTTNAANRTYAQPVYSALDAAAPFAQVSNGFFGAPSDGLKQLQASYRLTSLYTNAANGNLVQVARLAPGGDATDQGRSGESHVPVMQVTLALGFGASQTEAVGAAEGSLRKGFGDAREQYAAGWQRYNAGLYAPLRPAGLSGAPWQALVDEYYLNADLLKAAEDKTFPGAIAAGPTKPWGQAIQANDSGHSYYGAYNEVFARDLYEAWTGLVADGDLQTARDAVNFLFLQQQQPDGSMPRNSLPNGQPAPDSFNTQLDECSYPIIMAYQLGMTGASLYPHIKRAADFVVSHGPSFGPERWEEQSGYSPSTIAAEVAGLVAAADIADRNGDHASAQVYRATADEFQRSVKGWTVTTNGPLATHPYFIRLSKTGDPNAAITYGLGNGGPTLDQRTVIDQGFLELVRLGLFPANDLDVVASLSVVDATIKTVTASGPGWHRYNGDGYGDGATDGHPWAPSGVGTGHVWPVLTGERGEYSLTAGNIGTALSLLNTMRLFGGGVGLIPEQDWELPNLPAAPFDPYTTDPTTASIGFQNGQPAGSSAPLTWADGMYVRLLRDIEAGTPLDRPADTYNRYVVHQQGQTSVSIASPANDYVSSSPIVTVTGSSVAGNGIVVAASDTDNNTSTNTATTTAAGDGSFSVPITLGPGTNVVTVAATDGAGDTGYAQITVVYDFTPGTLVFDYADPSGDDNGPGNYAYPTNSAFVPGAYDLQDFNIHDDGTNYIFTVKTRDLTPTFGSPLGAQLLDVYVHNPVAAAADTSTSAAYASRNYQITPAAAWSRLLEVQGFGQQYVDAHGATQGTIAIKASQVTRRITFSVPKASMGGTIGSGWGFTVVLTGQDGFSPDQARSFAPTPQPYQFGVCAAASSDPHCTVDPTTVPKAMDVLTPPGMLQSNELDYTLHNPVVLQDVVIP
ncbi:MAG TPA: glucodextranase DOMON-like domain-containing protein [Chloroflexota bacterium]|nr:glucodextranase DOMON-like domain-containing protein [Chloroflexota bacterium]